MPPGLTPSTGSPIGTPALEAENDQVFAGQPARVHDALTCPRDLVVFSEAAGGGEHCHEGATALCHQQGFDWLDRVLAEAATATSDAVTVTVITGSDAAHAGTNPTTT